MQNSKNFPTIQNHLRHNSPKNMAVAGATLQNTAMAGVIPPSMAMTGGVPQNTAIAGAKPQSMAMAGALPQSMAMTGGIPQSMAMTGAIPKPSSWQHQIPNTMPWVQGGTSPPVSTTNHHIEGRRHVKNVPGIDRCIRTSRSPIKRSRSPAVDDCFEPDYKQLITEDKMAARLGELSITNDHSYSSRGRNHTSFLELERRLQEEDDSDDESTPIVNEVTVEIAPELQNMLKSKQQVLPNSIIKKVSDPCTALILWKPPESILPDSTLPVWKDNQEAIQKDEEETSSSSDSMCENGSVMETDRNNSRSDTLDVTGVSFENHTRNITVPPRENMQSETATMPQRQLHRIPQNNHQHFPRDLLIAASEIVDNNNDPGAVDIEEMNAGLNRHIRGQRLPVLRARRHLHNNVLSMRDQNPDDDMEL